MLRRSLWTLTGLYWTLCFVLTHVQLPAGPPGPSYDKIKHYLAYGGLAGAWYLCLWASKPRFRWMWLAVVALGMSYGAIDELTQPLVGRACEFQDWLADM